MPLEPDQIQGALDLELSEGAVVADTVAGEPAIFLSHLHKAERQIAEALQELAQGAPPWGAIDASRAIGWVEQRLGCSWPPASGRRWSRPWPARYW